jgi:hypothetical protein
VEEDRTNRSATKSIRFGLKVTHSGPRRADQTGADESPSSHTTFVDERFK